jgi:LPS O-antigen subunit length determinant protein (WzzB/FepE family)
MSNKLPEGAKQSEEVDLGQLFNLIGRAFDRLFKAIGKLTRWFFDVFLNFLLFVRANFFKISIPIIVATIIGYSLDSINPPTYTSTIVVKPNFNSNIQLYDNVSYLNSLVQSEDTLGLSKALNISVKEAGQLNSLSIRAIATENSRLKFFNDYIIQLDSSVIDIDALDYEKFNENISEMNFSEHIIEIESKVPYFPAPIQDAIVFSVDENDYFDLTKNTIAANIKSSTEILQKQLKEVDELREIYNRVIIAESEKDQALPNGGTSINFADKKQETKELNLFSETREINKQLTELSTRKANLERTVTVLSNLKPIGEVRYEFLKTMMFRFFLISFILTFLVLFLVEANKFLNNQERSRS